MRKSIFIILLLAASGISAQDLKDIPTLIYTTNHVSINLVPQLVQKAGITKTTGNYQLKSSSMEGIEIGANYYINFNKYYSLMLGLHGGASARNFILHIPKEDFTPPAQYDYDYNGAITREFDFYLAAPIVLERRWWYHKKKCWTANAGVQVRFYPDDITEYITSSAAGSIIGNGVQVTNFELLIGNNFKPWLTYTLGGGHSWVLGNYNMLNVGVLANLSNTKLVDGTYEITVPGQPVTEGRYSAKLSYIGVSISYVLTGANKTLRKLYEKKQDRQL